MVPRVYLKMGVGGGIAAQAAADHGGAGGEEEPLGEAAEFSGEQDESRAGEAKDDAFAIGDVHVQVAVEFVDEFMRFGKGTVGKGHTSKGLYELIRGQGRGRARGRGVVSQEFLNEMSGRSPFRNPGKKPRRHEGTKETENLGNDHVHSSPCLRVFVSSCLRGHFTASTTLDPGDELP